MEGADIKCGYLTLKNGLYFGEYDWRRNPHGHGILLWQSTDIYIGRFSEGKFDGKGLLIFANGGCALGTFKKGLFDGECFLKMGNGDIIIGWFVDGKRDGICLHFLAQKRTKYYRRYRKGVMEYLHKVEKGDLKEEDLIEYFSPESFDLNGLEKGDVVAISANEKYWYNNVIRFLGTKNKSFGVMVRDTDILEAGFFKRSRLDGYGLRLAAEGKIEGIFEDGMVHGPAYSFIFAERFGVLAEYSKDQIIRIIQKSKSFKKKISKIVITRSFGRLPGNCKFIKN